MFRACLSEAVRIRKDVVLARSTVGVCVCVVCRVSKSLLYMWVVLQIRVPLGDPFYKGAVLYWGPKKGACFKQLPMW